MKSIILPLYYFVICNGEIRTWIFGQNAYKENARYDCSGLIYPERFLPVTTLETRTLNKIVLPMEGYIALDDKANITLDPLERECFEVEINNDISYFQPRNWNSLRNRAIPLSDQLPCPWDDLVIPAAKTFGMEAPFMTFEVKSLTFFGETIDHSRLGELWDTIIGGTINVDFLFSPKSNCTRATCPCKHGADVEEVCTFVEAHPEQFTDGQHCRDAIVARGGCTLMCGVVLFMDKNYKHKEGILKMLAHEPNVDYYYGLLFDNDKRAQIVIADKEAETGGQYAKEVLERLKDFLDKKSDIKYVFRSTSRRMEEDFDADEHHIIIMASGEPIISGRFWSSTFGIILMTFFINLVIFALIYALFVSPLKNFDFRTFRVNPATFRPFLFARFDNANDLTDDDDTQDASGDGKCGRRRRRIDIGFSAASTSTLAPNESAPCSSATSTSSLSAASTSANFVPVHLEAAKDQAECAETLERCTFQLNAADCADGSAFDNPLYGKQIEEDNAQSDVQEASLTNEPRKPIVQRTKAKKKAQAKGKKFRLGAQSANNGAEMHEMPASSQVDVVSEEQDDGNLLGDF